MKDLIFFIGILILGAITGSVCGFGYLCLLKVILKFGYL